MTDLSNLSNAYHCNMPAVLRNTSKSWDRQDLSTALHLWLGCILSLNEDITKCLDTYCNTNLYVSTTVFVTQDNM